MRPSRFAALTLALVAAVAGCARSPETVASSEAPADAAPQEALPEAQLTRPSAAAPAAPPAPATALQSAAVSQGDGTRRFIRTAQAEFRVREVYRTALAIEQLAARHGGFTTRNDIRADIGQVLVRPIGDGREVELATYTVRGALQVRVPSERAQAFLVDLAEHVEFLDRRSFSAVDAQFDLLRQALAWQREQDAQRALGDLAQTDGRLRDRSGAVEARRQAQAARDEAHIEQKRFEDRVAFATLDLSLYQPPQVRRTERPDVEAIVRNEGPGFGTRLAEALKAGWFGLLGALIALAALWPLWLAAGLAAALLWRWRRSRGG